ncbi:ABC transporter substrate-binding protein [Ochrobactrum teleogrylli]|uniref:ABC transporter substrate-binding protein n=2 Tax=Ochrobactrum teleogrylli TaxID=2479765 RepID=A0ABY2Y1B6_9HYPH|nr:ABC transporter substrate-binding protein [[Ochrobactrum] teleogrylli]
MGINRILFLGGIRGVPSAIGRKWKQHSQNASLQRGVVMTFELTRRRALTLFGAGLGGAFLNMGTAIRVLAQDKDSITIAWPSDVPSWDPCQRVQPDAQPVYKMLFEQPVMQDVDLSFVPGLLTEWSLADDGLSFAFKVRQGVTFHDGSKLTAQDIRFNWYERVRESLNGGNKIDTANIWKNITDITLDDDYSGVFHFSSPMPTAVQWLAFMANFVVPKDYITKVGIEAFRDKPIGTGPYRLVEYQINSRMVFERNEDYWGERPAMRRVIVNVVKDPSARAAALQSGQADLTINVPVREAKRLGAVPGLAAEINPVTRIVLIQIRHDNAVADQNLRLALHHAIDKTALSRAFFAGAAVPLAVPVTPGTPGYVSDFTFSYDQALARELLEKSGYGPGKPAKVKFATTNGHFPSDYDIARALVAMWQKVGIEAELEVIEYAKYFELNRGGRLPDLTLYAWDNATGDPEIFTGYMLNPDLPFSVWHAEEPGQTIRDLFNTANYESRIEGYRAVNRKAVEMGASIPLLQSVQTLVRKADLDYKKFQNGWVLGQTLRWK